METIFENFPKTIVAIDLCFVLLLIMWAATKVWLLSQKRKRRKHRWFRAVKTVNTQISTKAVVITAGIIILGNLALNSFADKLCGNPQKHPVFHPDISKQTSIEDGFIEDRFDVNIEVNTAEPDEKKDPIALANERLHIPEDFLGADVSLDMLTYFDEIMERIYVEGARKEYLPLEYLLDVTPEYYSIDQEDLREAKQLLESYREDSKLSVEYHYGTLINNVGMSENASHMSFRNLLILSSDSVFLRENFLQYKNRIVDGHMISMEYISYVNGKLLLSNAPLFRKDPDGADYVNCLYAEAYCCFKNMVNRTSEDNKWYLLLAYYTGYSGQKLLGRINYRSEPVVYETIRTCSLHWFEVAKTCMEESGNYIMEKEDEETMTQNISDGIAALNKPPKVYDSVGQSPAP